MNNEQRQQIIDDMKKITEIRDHIDEINHLRNTHIEKKVYEEDRKKIVDYMDASPASRKFFSKNNLESLLKEYIEEIEVVSRYLGNSSFSEKEKVLNFMEYIRLNGMYENIPNSQFTNKTMRALISQTGLNIALLGKGVCRSQAQFLNHLLIGSGIKAYYYQIRSSNSRANVAHEVITAELSNNSYFLDPTWYNGTVESLKGSFEEAELTPQNREMLSTLEVSQQEINEARKNAQQFLIKRYGIQEISKQLGLDEATDDMDKQMRILAFMKENLAPTTHPLSVRSVVIRDREIEVGKLLELFYAANNIQYAIEGKADVSKENVVYSTQYEGEEYKLYLPWVYDNIRNTINGLHYFIDQDGQRKGLFNLPENKLNRIKGYCKNAVGIAKEVVIPEENLQFEYQGEEGTILDSVIQATEEISRTGIINEQMQNIQDTTKEKREQLEKESKTNDEV